MTRIVYHVAMSADGYIASADGGVAWLTPFEQSGSDHGFVDFYAGIDGLLFGSRTFEQALTFGPWPFSGKPCWVFSRRDLAVPEPMVEVTARSPREIFRECESRGLARVWLVGGGILASAFRSERLITDYVLAVVPILLGEGIPLFAEKGKREDLSLIGQQEYPTGIVLLKYERR